MQQGDRYCLDSRVLAGPSGRPNLGFIQVLQDVALSIQSFVDLENELMQRLSLSDSEFEKVRALLVADSQQIAKPARYEKRDLSPLALEQSVRAPRRRQSQIQRRQSLVKPGIGQQTYRQQGRFFRRLDRAKGASFQSRMRSLQLELSAFRIIAHDRALRFRIASHLQGVTFKEIRFNGRQTLYTNARLSGNLVDCPSQCGARKHFNTPLLALWRQSQAIRKGASGINEKSPHTRCKTLDSRNPVFGRKEDPARHALERPFSTARARLMRFALAIVCAIAPNGLTLPPQSNQSR